MNNPLGIVWMEFLSLLTLLFIGLKLTGHIDWSWWWVIGPLWAPAAVALIIVTVAYGLLSLVNKAGDGDD